MKTLLLATTIAFRGAMLVDGTGAAPQPDALLVVSGGKIGAVQTAGLEAPAGLGVVLDHLADLGHREHVGDPGRELAHRGRGTAPAHVEVVIAAPPHRGDLAQGQGAMRLDGVEVR